MRIAFRFAFLALLLVLILDLPQVLAGADFYKLLGITKNASKREIKKAYRKLSKDLHPDKNKAADAEEQFTNLGRAYETLIDDEKRRIYDKYGEEGLKNGGQQFHNPYDIFAQFAGFGGFGGGGFGHPQQRKGESVAIPLPVSLEDLFLGTTIEIEINKQVICPTCRGSGAKRAEDVVVCKSCNGNGIKIIRQMLGPGMYQQMQTQCDQCGGRGKVVKSKCSACDGHKVKRGSHQLSVTIERGMDDQQKIVMEQEADESPEITPGDIILTLKTSPHPVFTRQGDNLYAKEFITLKEALLGFTKKIRHLDGEFISVSRDGVTQPGFVQAIKNQGMPTHEFPSERGVLYVEYGVILPQSLSQSQQDDIEKILS
ncbi:hypothetical protein DFS34DRAFT_155724 [Phlyctochytrium arcticum]|nr:hypothetical protein DFS34DRAFT_155724 [Phlyctochytrium arcticum]